MHINRGDKLDSPPFKAHPEEQEKRIERHEADERRREKERGRRAAKAYWERRGGFDEW